MSSSPSKRAEVAARAKAADGRLSLDQQLCFPIYAASNLITRLYHKPLAELGLTYPQYLVMLVLWEDGTQSVGTLGDKLYLDSGTLTPLLKRMERAGLVERQRDPIDERRVLVSPTARGTALRRRAGVVLARLQAISPLLAPCSLDTLRDDVHGLIRALHSHLQDEKASP